ncbi:MAG: hypothetical protein PUP93_31180 [Rhizonema sp. NSF051]|nr:hypothetical protein [Rhizonema sp. NSF051]
MDVRLEHGQHINGGRSPVIPIPFMKRFRNGDERPWYRVMVKSNNRRGDTFAHYRGEAAIMRSPL